MSHDELYAKALQTRYAIARMRLKEIMERADAWIDQMEVKQLIPEFQDPLSSDIPDMIASVAMSLAIGRDFYERTGWWDDRAKNFRKKVTNTM